MATPKIPNNIAPGTLLRCGGVNCTYIGCLPRPKGLYTDVAQLDAPNGRLIYFERYEGKNDWSLVSPMEVAPPTKKQYVRIYPDNVVGGILGSDRLDYVPGKPPSGPWKGHYLEITFENHIPVKADLGINHEALQETLPSSGC